MTPTPGGRPTTPPPGPRSDARSSHEHRPPTPGQRPATPLAEASAARVRGCVSPPSKELVDLHQENARLREQLAASDQVRQSLVAENHRLLERVRALEEANAALTAEASRSLPTSSPPAVEDFPTTGANGTAQPPTETAPSDADLDDKECVVCLEQPRELRLPCGHKTLCVGCVKTVPDCPVCRVEFDWRQCLKDDNPKTFISRRNRQDAW